MIYWKVQVNNDVNNLDIKYVKYMSEEMFLSHRISILPRKGAELEHSWFMCEDDLPQIWIKTKPRQIVRTYIHPKTQIVWKFVLNWVKGRNMPLLRVYKEN